MGPTARWVQALGLLLFLATAFLPAYCPREHPLQVARKRANPGVPISLVPPADVSVPAGDVYDAVRLDLAADVPGCRTWEVRRWYPYVLAPFWLWALALVAGPASRWEKRRARVGVLLLILTLAVAAFEACYLAVEYAALFPEVLGRAEVVCAWILVVAVLLLRRRADRRLGAVEAHVGAMALLSLLHLLTLPSSEARPWVVPYAWTDVWAAVTTNFRPAFWLACAGLALAAGATYLTPRRAPAPPAHGRDEPSAALAPEPAAAQG